MRPRGEPRQALWRVAEQLGGDARVTWKCLAVQAGVGFAVARQTVRNMAAAGQFNPVGTARMAGVCRPMTLYSPAVPERAATGGGADLTRVWQRPR